MMSRSFLLLIASVMLSVLVSAPVDAFEKKKKAKKEVEPVMNVISAVGGNTIDVTTGASTKTLKISQFTEVKVNGQKASAADLKQGMTVSEVILGADPSVASRINAAGSAVAAETPAPAKKKRKKKATEEEG